MYKNAKLHKHTIKLKKKLKKKFHQDGFHIFFFPFQTSENLFSLQWKLANLKLRNSKIYLWKKKKKEKGKSTASIDSFSFHSQKRHNASVDRRGHCVLYLNWCEGLQTAEVANFTSVSLYIELLQVINNRMPWTRVTCLGQKLVHCLFLGPALFGSNLREKCCRIVSPPFGKGDMYPVDSHLPVEWGGSDVFEWM